MLCTMARDASGHAAVKTAEVADLAPDVSVVLLILFHLCMHNFSVLFHAGVMPLPEHVLAMKKESLSKL